MCFKADGEANQYVIFVEGDMGKLSSMEDAFSFRCIYA